MTLRRIALASFVAASLAACQAEKPVETQPVAELPKAPEPKPEPSCIGSVTTGSAQALSIAGLDWELAGSTLTQKSPAKSDSAVIGVVSDIKEDTAENLANLKALAAWFSEKKVDFIVVAGDTGETAQQIENALTVLAEVNVPVFNIAGNREGKQAYAAAMTAVHAKLPHVFDLNTVRRVDTPHVDLVSMPGYFNKSFMHAEDGCLYEPADVKSVVELAQASNSPVLLVSHGGPKQEGKEGIDTTADGANVGDPELTKAIVAAKIPFGIFGNIHEAGGRGVDLLGKTVIPQDTFADALYLNPGAADAVRWQLNDKTESVGMGAIMTIKGGKASYLVKRIDDPEAKIAKGGAKKPKGKK